MPREFDPTSGVLRGLLEDQPEAIATIRDWIASLVRGGGWRLTDPESAIQEVTLRVLHLGRNGRIREDADFKAFVFTIARHTCTDIYRRERLRGSIERPADSLEDRPGRTDDPERRLEEAERKRMLQFIYQALPDECRRLWRFVYGEGLPAAEVAVRLGISEVNVRVRVHRCLARAREIHGGYAAGGGGS